MKRELRIQNSESRMKCTAHSQQRVADRDSRLRAQDWGREKFIIHHSSFIVALLLVTCHSSLVTLALAATHVTATYDLGANPRVMTTVGGQPQYGLVFAQRNKAVTYNQIEYGPSVVKGYLNASGALNDGAGNLYLDLIPNTTASPSDSYYVVTVNIQGRVHAEIWVVPDLVSVSAEVCRQAQAPSSTAPAVFYQFVQQGGSDFPQRQKLNLIGSGITCTDNASLLRTDCTFAAGGGSAPLASATLSGTVKTDTTASDPVVYLKSSADTLLAGKASSVHTHSQNDVTNLTTDLAGKASAARSIATSAPLAGGGDLTADRTLSCPTCEVTGNKNAASGYAGLTASTKLNLAHGQEVWGVADLTDFASKSGSGTAAIGATITSPADNQCLTYDLASTTWVNEACPSGSGGDNISVNGTAATDADFDDSTPAPPSNRYNVKWQKDALTPNNLSAYVDPTLFTAPIWGAGAEFTWTFDAGVTDPTLRFGSNEAQFTGNFGIGVDPLYPLHVQSSTSSSDPIVVFKTTVDRTVLSLENADTVAGNTGVLDMLGDNAADKVFFGGLTGETYRRIGFTAGGALQLGPGSAPRDVRLYRTAAKQLEVDDNAGAAATFKVLGTLNATTGIQINAAGTADRYLKGNGTHFVISTGAASGTGACAANTWASTLNSDAAPTCTQPGFSNLSGTLGDAQIADGAVDGGNLGEIADGSVTADDLGTDSVSADELNATGVEAELEAVLDLDQLQGAIGDAQIAAAAVDGGSAGEIADGTVDSNDLATANKTISKSIVILDPATTQTNKVQWYWPTAVTIQRVACSTDTGTVTIQFDERAEATPNTAGTNTLSAALVCDADSQTTTSFSDSGIAADVPHNLQITATASSPTVVRIHIRAGIN